MNETAKVLREKSFAFALRIVKLTQCLEDAKRNWVLSRQLLKSGTSIGANIRESKFAQSNSDFISKLSIALKEANETEYWLNRLYHGHYLTQYQYESLFNDIDSIISILTKIVKTLKEQQKAL